MAGSKHFLSHARRHYSTPSHFSFILYRNFSYLNPSCTRHFGYCKSPSTVYTSNSTSKSSFLGFPRLFSASDSQDEDPIRVPTQSPLIKPVSYAIKPKDPSAEEETPNKSPSEESRRPRELRGTALPPTTTDSEQAENVQPRAWTREDIRYMKDTPLISTVSYPSRVASLPEDKASTSPEEAAAREESRMSELQLERERMKTQTDPNPRVRRILRLEDEKVPPFPTLIKVEKNKQKAVLDLQDAIREVKANARAKFDETIEAHVKLGVDPRRGDQMVRGATSLPHGTGKTIRIAVFAEGSAAEEAKAAGADLVGGEELIEEIRKGGKLNFDKCIATPTFMPRLGKVARILGPRGLMPNPKLGSVTSDVAEAVKAAKRGRIDFKIDKTAIVHVGLGKVSFTEESLRENVGAFVNALLLAKPVGLKKTSKYAGYVNSFSLCSTMGPGFPVSIQSLSMAADHYNKIASTKPV